MRLRYRLLLIGFTAVALLVLLTVALDAVDLEAAVLLAAVLAAGTALALLVVAFPVRHVVDRALDRQFRQVEALQNLYAMIDVQHALPNSRGWAASPDLMLLLVDLVDRHRPARVVECGSGLSTLCFALAMRRFGIDGRVTALEHLDDFAEQTRELLRRHGVDDIAEVRTAPLGPVDVRGLEVQWYDATAWEDLADVDLLFVDGPPAGSSSQARYPALPALADRMRPGALIVLDDFQRSGEQAVAQRWNDDLPGRLQVREVPLEKGAAVITLQ